MKVQFDRSFLKSLDKISHQKTKDKILDFIESAKQAKTLQDLRNVRKLKGFETFYRYRFGDYRIGFELLETGAIYLIVVAKRNDIYKVFP